MSSLSKPSSDYSGAKEFNTIDTSGLSNINASITEHLLNAITATLQNYSERFVSETREGKKWGSKLFRVETYLEHHEEGKIDNWDFLTLEPNSSEIKITPEDAENTKSDMGYSRINYITNGDMKRVSAQAISSCFQAYLKQGNFGFDLDNIKKVGFKMYVKDCLGQNHLMCLEDDLTKMENNPQKYTLYS